VNVRQLTAGLLVLASCHRRPPAAAPSPPAPDTLAVPSPPPEPPWPRTVAAVRAAVDSGQYSTADSILAAFERAERDSPDVAESAFWRAMLRADPRNPAFEQEEARRGIESYLAAPNPRRRNEAGVMLRLLELSDSLRAAQAAQRSAAEDRDRAQEEEIQKLRDDLQRTQAELERIKRRLGTPKP
jgi:hypothetical protein